MWQTNKLINTILGVTAILSLFYVLVGRDLSFVTVLNEMQSNRYLVYFVPPDSPRENIDELTMAKKIDDLLDAYTQFVEKNLESRVIHHYTATLRGIAVEIKNSKGLKKVLSSVPAKPKEITPELLSQILYDLKKEEIEALGLQLKVEKDRKMTAINT